MFLAVGDVLLERLRRAQNDDVSVLAADVRNEQGGDCPRRRCVE
jgi:hypothetical protein